MTMRRRIGPLLSLTAILGWTACSDSPTEPGPPERITELPRALTVAELELLGAGNRFGVDLLGELAASPAADNLFFSPLSASMALGMTLNGADGTTFDEMRQTLGFGELDQAAINESFKTLLELLQELDPSVTVQIANSVWHELTREVAPDFLDRVREYFEAQVEGVNFGDPATLVRINDWVSEKTEDRIPSILNGLPAGVVMVLLNAIYFQGDWTEAFDPEDTQPGPFTREDGVSVAAELMSREGMFGYRRGTDHQVVEIPYGGQAFVLTAVLPDPGVSVTDLVVRLDEPTWSAWVDGLDSARVHVRLPKFELEWEAELNEPLKKLGMVDAFEAGSADFSRAFPGGGPWIDKVFQKSFVKVDEVGTEAAAVTAVVIVESAPAMLSLDRPFLFAIRERLSGTVLFLGVLQDPSE